MSISSIDVNVQALHVIGRSLVETAHNVANVNTHGFESRRVDLEDGPKGQGVQVAALPPNTTAGPLEPLSSGLPPQAVQELESETEPGFAEGSNTSLETELTQFMRDERAFLANLTVIAMRMDSEDTVISELTG